MDNLDAFSEEVIRFLLEGQWSQIFNKAAMKSIVEWLDRQRGEGLVAFRFVFNQPSSNENYSIYMVCSPYHDSGRVRVVELVFPEEHPLAVPPRVYPLPLYCIPRDFFGKLINKKKS